MGSYYRDHIVARLKTLQRSRARLAYITNVDCSSCSHDTATQMEILRPAAGEVVFNFYAHDLA